MTTAKDVQSAINILKKVGAEIEITKKNKIVIILDPMNTKMSQVMKELEIKMNIELDNFINQNK